VLELAGVLLVIIMMLAAGAALLGVLLVRKVRRSLASHPLAPAARAVYNYALARPPLPWQPAYTLYRRTSAATRALALAHATGAPTGQLDALAEQLVTQTDYLIEAYRTRLQRTSSASDFAAHLTSLVPAADTIHTSALAAVHSSTSTQVAELTVDATTELTALGAGLAQLHPPTT
jgi:hypothetical protein